MVTAESLKKNLFDSISTKLGHWFKNIKIKGYFKMNFETLK